MPTGIGDRASREDVRNVTIDGSVRDDRTGERVPSEDFILCSECFTDDGKKLYLGPGFTEWFF